MHHDGSYLGCVCRLGGHGELDGLFAGRSGGLGAAGKASLGAGSDAVLMNVKPSGYLDESE